MREAPAAPTFGISCLHFAWRNLEEAFQRCAQDFGFQVLELSTTKLKPEDYAQIRRLRARYELELGLHAWTNLPQLGAEWGREVALDLLAACQSMEVRHLVLHLGTHADRAAGLAILKEILSGVAPAYERAGVLLCLENHYPYEYKSRWELGGSPDDFLQVLPDLSPAAVGFCQDFGHSHMGDNHFEFLQLLGERLVYVHLADNMGEHDDHLSYGQGSVPWDAIFRATVQQGFSGPYIIEFPEARGREHIDACVEHIKRVWVQERE